MKQTRNLFLIAALAVAMIATSCKSGGKKEWPQADQDAFIQNCVPGAQKNPGIDADKYCKCMLGKIMEKYPKPDDASKINMDEMMDMAKDCM